MPTGNSRMLLLDLYLVLVLGALVWLNLGTVFVLKYRFDEMGRYDLPAVFNHVLTVTGRNKLVYVGFSIGKTPNRALRILT